jgi:hypothetical protein
MGTIDGRKEKKREVFVSCTFWEDHCMTFFSEDLIVVVIMLLYSEIATV